ncbi:hypothetical protein NQ317_012412 [Molorchus minor]|uniref:Uncharacterized protein n=1 Tax=Molorchus minor TaxID=1323400 RepID=A0ABQ9JGC6_9CUCU|nr:hypothetical protein NQ317_012412 [Molorchus minor]
MPKKRSARKRTWHDGTINTHTVNNPETDENNIDSDFNLADGRTDATDQFGIGMGELERGNFLLSVGNFSRYGVTILIAWIIRIMRITKDNKDNEDKKPVHLFNRPVKNLFTCSKTCSPV